MSSEVTPAPKSVRPTADTADLAKTPVTLGVVLFLLAGVIVVATFFLYRDYAQGEQLTVIREAIAAHRQETVAQGARLVELRDAMSATTARLTAIEVLLAKQDAKLDKVLDLVQRQAKP